LLSKKLGKLPAKLPAEGFGMELGQECGLGFGIALGKQRYTLSGKEPGKELSLLPIK